MYLFADRHIASFMMPLKSNLILYMHLRLGHPVPLLRMPIATERGTGLNQWYFCYELYPLAGTRHLLTRNQTSFLKREMSSYTSFLCLGSLFPIVLGSFSMSYDIEWNASLEWIYLGEFRGLTIVRTHRFRVDLAQRNATTNTLVEARLTFARIESGERETTLA